jgi:hypothetical protein
MVTTNHLKKNKIDLELHKENVENKGLNDEDLK